MTNLEDTATDPNNITTSGRQPKLVGVNGVKDWYQIVSTRPGETDAWVAGHKSAFVEVRA
jgi:hypothetical protein